MDQKELIEGCERQLEDSARAALQVMSPAQLVTLDALGLRVVPKWMVDVLLRVVTKHPAKPEGE